jgi:hypothetical protein
MSSGPPPSKPVPPNRERSLAMVLAAIIGVLAVAAVLIIVLT